MRLAPASALVLLVCSSTFGSSVLAAQATDTVRHSAFPFGLPDSRYFNMLEPNYFLTGFQDRNGRDSLGGTQYANQVKFRVAVRYRVLGTDASETGLYFGYTQNSFWNFWEASRPFFDNNYNPMAFVYLDATQWPGSHPWYEPSVRLLVEHESNGRDGASSRGWNREGVGFDVGHLDASDPIAATLLVWHAFDLEDNNPDLPDYNGRGELTVHLQPLSALHYDMGSFGSTIKLRLGGRQFVTSREINVFVRPSRLLGPARGMFSFLNSSIALQWFSGTGETLLDYNVRRSSFRVGLATVR